MGSLGRSERRLAAIFFFTVLIPLIASGGLAYQTIRVVTWLYTNADTVGELERSLDVYGDLAKAMKDGLRAKADAIAAQEPLRAAAILRHSPSVEQELDHVFGMYPDLVSLTITAPGDEGETRLGYKDRGRPLDEKTERRLEVRRPLADRDNAPEMTAVFAAPRARLDDIERVAELVKTYKAMQQGANDIPRLYYLRPYATLLGLTAIAAVAIGLLVARQVTGRINELALAARAVGGGDLSVRVHEKGSDEITELSRAFNHMVSEVEASRARIEFLQRMGTWQEMARRLAHEIKNPLTPIQLAVQECHRRYDGESRAFRKLLDTTAEIVEEEVGTLRRLVSEFSNFARMPRASLDRADLGEFLRDQRSRLLMLEGDEKVSGALSGVTVEWVIPAAPMLVAFDPHLLHRVLVNVVGNAAQAVRSQRPVGGRVKVEAVERPGQIEIDIDDDGPGVPPEMRDRIFDPYFTTKAEGTGLGLAIVKKVVMEHGGSIEAIDGPLGGARVRIRLPLSGTPSSEAALASSERPSQPPSSGASGASGG